MLFQVISLSLVYSQVGNVRVGEGLGVHSCNLFDQEDGTNLFVEHNSASLKVLGCRLKLNRLMRPSSVISKCKCKRGA
jgi:hypothetical protein